MSTLYYVNHYGKTIIIEIKLPVVILFPHQTLMGCKISHVLRLISPITFCPSPPIITKKKVMYVQVHSVQLTIQPVIPQIGEEQGRQYPLPFPFQSYPEPGPGIMGLVEIANF